MSEIRFSVGCDSWQEETCMGYQSLTTFATRTEAIAAWNKRPPERNEVWVYGTDGCKNCETGRITLYAKTGWCVECQAKKAHAHQERIGEKP